MRMNGLFSQETRHNSAMPQQVSCTRGRTVGIKTTYSLDRKIHIRLWDVGISCYHSEGEEGTEALNLTQSLAAGRCSWVAWLRMSFSHPQGEFLLGPKEAFSQQTPWYCKTTQDWPKTWSFLVRERGCSRQMRGPWGTFPAPNLPPHGTDTNWEYLNLLLKQESPRKRGSCSATSPEQGSPLLSLDWHGICSRP